MTAVWKHELKSYFHSLTAYVFGAFLLAFIGFGSMLYNIQAAVSSFELVLSFSTLIFVVIVPILTMRVIAEERRQKTDQLLYSLPITTTQVVLGKYLALLAVYLIPLCIVSLYPLIFAQFGDVFGDLFGKIFDLNTHLSEVFAQLSDFGSLVGELLVQVADHLLEPVDPQIGLAQLGGGTLQ